MDVYVVNDFAPNNLYRNDGSGTFTDVTAATGTADLGFGMGASWGDYDGDGLQDLYVTNMHSKAGLRIAARLNDVDGNFGRMARGNTLFRNRMNGFEQVSGLERPGLLVEAAGWGWGSQFLDLDNDSDLDIHALSGFYTAPSAVELPRGHMNGLLARSCALGRTSRGASARNRPLFDERRNGSSREHRSADTSAITSFSTRTATTTSRSPESPVWIIPETAGLSPFSTSIETGGGTSRWSTRTRRCFSCSGTRWASGVMPAGWWRFASRAENRFGFPSTEWSSRDGYGARVLLDRRGPRAAARASRG